MTSTAAPFGIVPFRHLGGGTIRPNLYPALLASGYAAALGLNSPVTIDATTQKLRAALVNEDIFGVFGGVMYRPSGATLYEQRKNWIASSVADSSVPIVPIVFNDPNISYQIQANGTVAATSVLDQADFVNPGTVNTLGESVASMNATLGGAGVQKQLRIMDVVHRPDNAWGDAFPILEVQIARLQTIANKVGV